MPKNPREVWPEIKERIEFAFTINGVDYYHFPEFLDTPCIRAFYSLTCFEEMKSSCTREFLVSFQKEMEAALNPPAGKPVNLSKIYQMNEFMKQRLEWVFIPSIAYKLCALVFFDETESPMELDQVHTQKKADIFASQKMDNFFFLQPISELVKVGTTSISDLLPYLTTVEELNELQLSKMSSKA